MSTPAKIDIGKAISEAAYNPKKGWSSAAQPIQGGSVEEYLAIAEDAKDDLKKQCEEFCHDHGFGFIWIPHEAFVKYERSHQGFREWLDEYCQQHGLNARTDICFVGPCTKTQESAERKTQTGNPTPDRVIDYLRVMPVVLKQNTTQRNRDSLATLERMMQTMESDQRSIARKNYFWEPHDGTGMRAHKSLWVCKAGPDSNNADFEILAEIKVEHESQMDIDKLTRNFLNISRNSRRYAFGAFAAAAEFLDHLGCKIAAGHSVRAEQNDRIANKWGKMLYDRINCDASMDRFLDPDLLSNKAAPLNYGAIRARIKEDLHGFPKPIQKLLISALVDLNIFPVKSSRQHPTNLREVNPPEYLR